LAFEYRALISGSDKILINSSSLSIVFPQTFSFDLPKTSSIDWGEMLATLNLSYFQPWRSLFHRGGNFDNCSHRSGPPMHGPDSGCSINAFPPGIIGLFSNN
jgi:hypothetical protein